MSSNHKHIGGRTLSRCNALQLLFQAEASGRSVADVLSGEYALSEGPLDEYGELLARAFRGLAQLEPLSCVCHGPQPAAHRPVRDPLR